MLIEKSKSKEVDMKTKKSIGKQEPKKPGKLSIILIYTKQKHITSWNSA